MSFNPGNPGQRTRKADRMHKVEGISYARGWIACICGDETTLSPEEMEAAGRMVSNSLLHDWFADHLRLKGQVHKT